MVLSVKGQKWEEHLPLYPGATGTDLKAMRMRPAITYSRLQLRPRLAGVVTICLLNSFGAVWADTDPTPQNSVDGKVNRAGIDLFYRVLGPPSGDYVLVLSGGPGEDIHSMQGIADELGKKYRCIMWEQRGTGRSKLPRYDESMINLNAYMDDIE